VVAPSWEWGLSQGGDGPAADSGEAMLWGCRLDREWSAGGANGVVAGGARGAGGGRCPNQSRRGGDAWRPTAKVARSAIMSPIAR
jgi:hypothetical protein